ncbi:EamA family transporter [Amycolatopsis sp. YIM 10]|uniref:EamA family transporter n=1 Tax=Amycolatopsis sp. YIM 10 TaxID=2653857 RepID=UPI001290069B|nr:EamA family transporter [Amycolatopsis sp. YIM 10]QFU85628.1 putative amino-acid metabolite efflux pump [Amycolatopsis sp. YIM 10]
MARRDLFTALLVAVLWGCNFLAIHALLDHFPPLFAGALRFAVIAVPTILFVPWPKVKVRHLLGYGLGFGTGQFAFLFIAMDNGMPTGLASLVLQASAPFTVLLGAVFLRERFSVRQTVGITVAIAAMVMIAAQRAENAALLPVLLTLMAALSWAVGNLSTRRAKPSNALHFTLWMSVVPPLPMLALSMFVEGPGAGWHAVTTIGTTSGWTSMAGLAYIVLLGTVAGSGLWTMLMQKYPAGRVAPFSLLVPVVGMSAAFVFLGERPHPVEIIAGVVLVAGVLLGSTASSVDRRQRGADRDLTGEDVEAPVLRERLAQ